MILMQKPANLIVLYSDANLVFEENKENLSNVVRPAHHLIEEVLFRLQTRVTSNFEEPYIKKKIEIA